MAHRLACRPRGHVLGMWMGGVGRERVFVCACAYLGACVDRGGEPSPCPPASVTRLRLDRGTVCAPSIHAVHILNTRSTRRIPVHVRTCHRSLMSLEGVSGHHALASSPSVRKVVGLLPPPRVRAHPQCSACAECGEVRQGSRAQRGIEGRRWHATQAQRVQHWGQLFERPSMKACCLQPMAPSTRG